MVVKKIPKEVDKKNDPINHGHYRLFRCNECVYSSFIFAYPRVVLQHSNLIGIFILKQKPKVAVDDGCSRQGKFLFAVLYIASFHIFDRHKFVLFFSFRWEFGLASFPPQSGRVGILGQLAIGFACLEFLEILGWFLLQFSFDFLENLAWFTLLLAPEHQHDAALDWNVCMYLFLGTWNWFWFRVLVTFIFLPLFPGGKSLNSGLDLGISTPTLSVTEIRAAGYWGFVWIDVLISVYCIIIQYSCIFFFIPNFGKF